MTTDAAPTIGLIISLIAGAIAGGNGRSGGFWGTVACVLFFVVWQVSGVTFSTTPQFGAAIAILGVLSTAQGAIWGAIWGAVGSWLGRKVSRQHGAD